MIDTQLEQLRSIVNSAEGLPDATKSEILQRLEAVQLEIGGIGQPSDADASADDIPAVTETAHALGRLAGAVKGLEVSHPQITATVNNIATALANIGI